MDDSRVESHQHAPGDERIMLSRGLAHARAGAWASVRHDMRAVLDIAPLDPRTACIAGTALIVARDYDRGMAALARAAGGGPRSLAAHARARFVEFAQLLGWREEARTMLDAIAATLASGDLEGRTRELRRRSGVRQREADALLGSTEQAADKAWRRVVEDGVAASERSLAALLERRGEQPHVLALQARLDLLRGEYVRAALRLADASQPATHGERAALALACGRLDEVLELTRGEATLAPRLLLLRGEALLGAGRMREAASTLARAQAALPRSLAVALALALARHAEQPRERELAACFSAVLADAPALLVDAADLLDLSLSTEADPLAPRDIVRVLEQARALLTADRDPRAQHYQRPGRPLRLVSVTARGQPSRLLRLHEFDRRRIDELEQMLSPTPPRGRACVRTGVDEVWTPHSLSHEQIEQFVRDGVLVLTRAFDPTLAERWRADANRRLRDEPDKWVRGYDPGDRTRCLRRYSPHDRTTWTWPRLVLDGNEEVSIESFSPTGWAAICDLLGGPHRMATRTWSNNLNVNFRALHDDTDEFEAGRPRSDWSGWHLDDPPPRMRLDNLRNGLVCFLLVDRILPDSGSTWLCLDSVAAVARELAMRPAGVDFVHERGAAITRRCSRFSEVVGEAGDLVLMHPLMIHTASPNRSGRIRWMSNPMVYVNAPLDPLRRELERLSPVELAIRRALA